MSNSYYTSVEFENEQYVGRVYVSNTNQLVYTSKGYNTLEQAAKDARTFVIKGAPTVNPESLETTVQPKKTITNIATYKFDSSRPSGRCCGR